MNFSYYHDSLNLLSRIIQLYSITKTLSTTEWNEVKSQILYTITVNISSIFENKPIVQIVDLKINKIIATSDTAITHALPNIQENNIKMHLFHGEYLYIQDSIDNMSDCEKVLLHYIVDHLQTVQSWRDSFESSESSQNKLELLHKITVSIRNSLDLSEVLATTAKDLGETFKVNRCFIRRYDPQIPGRVLATEEEYTSAGIIKAADIIFDFETEWMKNLNNILYDTDSKHIPHYLYINDVATLDQDNEIFNNLVSEIKLRSFFAIPLINQNIVLGCICFHQCNDSELDAWEPLNDLRFIQQVADEATGAIVHAEMYQEIQTIAKTDELTGLYNRAYFNELINKETERARRTNSDLSVIMIDLDFLKRANDNHGHLIGDEVIQTLALKLKQNLRQIDFVARFGGDEFGVILPDTSLVDSKILVQRLIQNILNTVHPIAGQLSASMGVAGTPHCPINIDELIKQADEALYLAKSLGKGRVCFADELKISE